MQLRKMTAAAICAAIMAVTSQVYISLPGAVPQTLQVLFAVFCGILLGPKWGAGSLLLWICMGLAGLPVFTEGKSGLFVLVGPTGGFLIGFVVQAFLGGYLMKISSIFWRCFAAIASLCFVYLIGLVGFMLSFHYFLHKDISLPWALTVAVLPFIPMDIIKVILGTLLGTRIYRALQKAGLMV